MKRTLIDGALLLSCVLALRMVGLAQNNGIATDPDISAIVSSISADRIETTALAMQHFFTRNSCSDTVGPGEGVTPARDYLFNRYSALQGLQVQLDAFTHPNCTTKPTYNVIGWIP